MRTDLNEDDLALLAALREAGFHLLAGDIEERWRRGKSAYIDSRVDMSQTLRSWFKTNNQQRH